MNIPVPDDLLPADRLGRVHFVGIGGAGLSAIARIMLARGIAVTGSDGRDSAGRWRRCARWARAATSGTAPSRCTARTPWWSPPPSARTTPRCVEAARLGLRLLPRSAALESVMRGRRVVAVAGTHGKTTTTSLLTVALQHCGADPSFAVGATLNATGRQCRTTGPASCSSPRPTRATARSWCTRRSPRWSPTSRPTTSTTTAPRRPTAPPSARSWTGSTPTGSWSPASTIPAPPSWPGRRGPWGSPSSAVGESAARTCGPRGWRSPAPPRRSR